jgi:hypothetical protein
MALTTLPCASALACDIEKQHPDRSFHTRNYQVEYWVHETKSPNYMAAYDNMMRVLIFFLWKTIKFSHLQFQTPKQINTKCRTTDHVGQIS